MLSWQTKKDFIEVIMINDCSPNTECEYQDLIDEFQSKLSLKYYKTEVNSGPGIARQIGLNNCNTQWVMFHDDDDMLNNPYVIETYLNVINNIPDNIIVSAINGPHLEYQTFSNNFIKDNHNFTGNLFNNNIIKLFDIQYPDLSYEEDRYFAMQYYYCVNRISTYFPYLQIQEINIIDNNSNFIAYTKQYNNQSICSSLTEQKRIDKALEFLYHTFTFYMNIPKDELLFKLLNNNLIYDFYYIVQWISYIDNYQFSDQQKTKILLIDEYLQTLLEFSGLKLPIDLSETYINFIKQLNN